MAFFKALGLKGLGEGIGAIALLILRRSFMCLPQPDPDAEREGDPRPNQERTIWEADSRNEGGVSIDGLEKEERDS